MLIEYFFASTEDEQAFSRQALGLIDQLHGAIGIFDVAFFDQSRYQSLHSLVNLLEVRAVEPLRAIGNHKTLGFAGGELTDKGIKFHDISIDG